jgi:hypothetical protein
MELYGRDVAQKIARIFDAKVIEIEGGVPSAEVIKANAVMAIYQNGDSSYSWRGQQLLRVEVYVDGWSQGIRIIESGGHRHVCV